MPKPNYSESQLQAYINAGISHRLYNRHREHFLPVIIDLREEAYLGWDSGFHLPWLHSIADPSHRGCNFFIQYKLSEHITRSNGKYYNSWNEPYFKFPIPHKKKGRADFHQFNILKNIADRDYPVFYATNQIMDFDHLKQVASRMELLEQTPFLKINDIKDLHKEVSFTKASDFFYLHSEIENLQKRSWESIFFDLNPEKGTYLRDDIKSLSDLLIQTETDYWIGGISFKDSFANINKARRERMKSVYQSILISNYLRLNFDLYWYRVII